MYIINNEIHYDGHKVVLDLKLHLAMPEYIEEMAAALYEEGSAVQHEEELDLMNNDGSWTIHPI